MVERKFTCIVCPKSCSIVLQEEQGELVITGNGCARGAVYARKEYENPARMITTTISITGGKPGLLPVISTGDVPKSKLKACMAVLYETVACAPVRQGDVMLHDILGLGVDIVAARDIKKQS